MNKCIRVSSARQNLNAVVNRLRVRDVRWIQSKYQWTTWSYSARLVGVSIISARWIGMQRAWKNENVTNPISRKTLFSSVTSLAMTYVLKGGNYSSRCNALDLCATRHLCPQISPSIGSPAVLQLHIDEDDNDMPKDCYFPPEQYLWLRCYRALEYLTRRCY